MEVFLTCALCLRLHLKLDPSTLPSPEQLPFISYHSFHLLDRTIIITIMCFSCGNWPWSQPIQLAAEPVKQEYIFLDDNVGWYQDTRSVRRPISSEDLPFSPACLSTLQHRRNTLSHLFLALPTFLLSQRTSFPRSPLFHLRRSRSKSCPTSTIPTRTQTPRP